MGMFNSYVQLPEGAYDDDNTIDTESSLSAD